MFWTIFELITAYLIAGFIMIFIGKAIEGDKAGNKPGNDCRPQHYNEYHCIDAFYDDMDGGDGGL